jgi:predicted metalloprotease with PDZ domain
VQIDFFGGAPESRPPMDYYAFLTMALGDARGGLEHRASTALVCSRDALPRAGMTDATDPYIDFMGLVSHEYFHTWNVKRIKPAAFTPYDLSREAYTRQLWIFEGFTSYYDNLMMLRSGLITVEQYLVLSARHHPRCAAAARQAERGRVRLMPGSHYRWTRTPARSSVTSRARWCVLLTGSCAANRARRWTT